MIYISHRGNLTGPNKKWENNPEYIRKALDDGFNVEIGSHDMGPFKKNWQINALGIGLIYL